MFVMWDWIVYGAVLKINEVLLGWYYFISLPLCRTKRKTNYLTFKQVKQ